LTSTVAVAFDCEYPTVKNSLAGEPLLATLASEISCTEPAVAWSVALLPTVIDVVPDLTMTLMGRVPKNVLSSERKVPTAASALDDVPSSCARLPPSHV
jgi:hypothetical protein